MKTEKLANGFHKINISYVLKYLLSFLVLVILWSHWIHFFEEYATPMGADWNSIFRPATLALLHGISPYSIPSFTNPPWALIPLIPFSLLPRPFDFLFFSLASFAIFGIVANRFGARPLTIVLFLSLPQLVWGIEYGNIDCLVSLGIIIPGPIGILLLATKPQIGFPILVFKCLETYKDGGIKKVASNFSPLIILTIVSIILIGSTFKPSQWQDFPGNLAYFPYLIPVGLILFYRSLKNADIRQSIAAGPFLTPYIGVQSLPLAIIGFLGSEDESLIAIASFWIIFLLRGTN